MSTGRRPAIQHVIQADPTLAALASHPVAFGSGLPMFRDLPKALVLEHTGGSLLIVMVAHAGYDLANTLVGTPQGADLSPIIVVAYAIAAGIVVILTGARWLSRKHYYPVIDPARAEAGGIRKS